MTRDELDFVGRVTERARRAGIPPIGGGSPAAAAAPASAPGRSQAPPGMLLPFTQGAHEHTEPAFDVSVQPGAAAVSPGPFDVPAFGFARYLNLEISCTLGVLGAGTLSADFPFNLFQSLAWTDVNGAPIYGPLDGFATLVANYVGGVSNRPDPRAAPNFVGTINAVWNFRIPIEVAHHDGFGSLANQNSAAPYRIQMTLNPSTTLFTVAPTTVPTFRIVGRLEAWTLPNDENMAGMPQAQLPPMEGSTQFWSAFTKAIAAGANTTQATRLGNLIRAHAFIARNAAGARVDTVFPDPVTWNWDGRAMRQDSQAYVIQRFFEQMAGNQPARDAGVYAYLYNQGDDGQVGDDDPTFWLPTVQSTRMEWAGASAVAGSLQVITNDIAPAEVSPAERFVETSRSGQLVAPTVPTM